MSRVAASRFALAALLLLPCSLMLVRHFSPDGQPSGADEELKVTPAMQLSQETKPTIVRPSEDWMDENVPRGPLTPDDAGVDGETEPPHDVPYLPPPLQASDVPPVRRR